jgi:prepilin signal peptidase PulO-like enzyme (type II secretory pathway)
MAAAALNVSLVLLLGIVTLSDLRTRLIPDRPLIAAVTCVMTLCALASPSELGIRLLTGICAGGFLLGAALVRPGGMGLGDVKLGGVLGLYLGPGVVAALLVAFAAGAVAGLAVLVRHGWAARTRALPFAPFLSLGALVVLAAQG